MWIHYFVNVILQAQTEAEQQVNFTLLKAKFFDRHKNHINERQLIVIRRMLEEGVEGFEGGINARKYIAITHVSKATATRDLQDMEQKGILESLGSGRNTRYQIAL
jgi:Fic family protein